MERLNFLTTLKDYYKPQWNIEKGASDIMNFYKSVNFDTPTFNGYKCTRLKALKKRLEEGVLDENWRVIGR
jgi:hypothetical protein